MWWLLVLQTVSTLSGSLAGLGHGSLPESVAETPANGLQVAHTAGSGGLPPLGLNRPVVCNATGRNLLMDFITIQ